MEIYFDSENASLKVTWLNGNGYLSDEQYVECWYSIQKYIEVLKPNILLIDAKYLEFRPLPEIQDFFNRISEIMSPEHMVIIQSKNTEGSTALLSLITECPEKGHKVFDNKEQAIAWLLYEN